MWDSNPQAAADITVLFEQMKADPKLIDKLTTRGRNQFGQTDLDVKPWLRLWNRGVDLWRLRIYDEPFANYRIVYGYAVRSYQIVILAVVRREDFDYDAPDHAIAQRILEDWRNL